MATVKIAMEETSGSLFPCDSITTRAHRLVDVVRMHGAAGKAAHLSVGYYVSTFLVSVTGWDLGCGDLLASGLGLKVRGFTAFE